MPIYTSLLTAGLLAASLIPTETVEAHSFNGTGVHSSPIVLTQLYNDDGDYLHRGSGR